MNPLSRIIASSLGAGVLAMTGAGLAYAAPTQSDTDTANSGSSSSGSPTGDAGPPTGGGQVTPEPGGSQVYALDGLGVPLTDPTLGVPKVLEAGVIPLAALSDLSGESGTAPGAGAPSPGSY